MKKNTEKIVIAAIFLTLSGTAYAQEGRVGINTPTPAATLDVAASPSVSTRIDGLIPPRLKGSELKAKDNLYTSSQDGAIVYVTEAVSGTTDKTTNVASIGYYYFDKTQGTAGRWMKLTPSYVEPWYNAANNLPATSNTQDIYQSGKIGIGAATDGSALYIENNNAGDLNDDASITTYSNTNTPSFFFNRSRGTKSSPSNLQNGDVIGGINFRGRATTNGSLQYASSINGIYTGDGTTNSGEINFKTSDLYRMKISDKGYLGIGTSAPAATLDVAASPSVSTSIDGFIPPRLKGSELQAKDNLYTSSQDGAIVYVTEAVSGTTDKTTNVASIGYYYFDKTQGTAGRWMKLTPSYMEPWYNAANNLPATSNTQDIYQSGKIGIGAATQGSALYIENNNVGDGNDDATIVTYSSSYTPSVSVARARGTKSSPSNLQNGDVIGGINFSGIANNSWQGLSSIYGKYTGDGTTNSGELNFKTSGTDRMKISNQGNVGIGNSAPITKLDARTSPGNASPGEGSIGIGETTSATTAAGAGAIRYSTSSGGALQYSNGTSWNTLSSNVQKSTVIANLPTGAFTFVNNAVPVNTVTGWTESVDVNSDFNPTTGVFTVPRTGNYLINCALLCDKTQNQQLTQFEIQIYLGDNMVADGLQNAQVAGIYVIGSNISAVVKASVGNEIRIKYYHNLGIDKKNHEYRYNSLSITEL